MKSSNKHTKKLGKFVIYLLLKNVGKQILLLIYSLYKNHAWQNIILRPGSSDIGTDSHPNTGKMQIVQPAPALDDSVHANSYES